MKTSKTNNVKIRLVLSFSVLCFLSGCYFEFDEPLIDDYYDSEQQISTGPGKITAKNIWDFGKIIATDKDHVLVSSYEDIHIFKHNSSGIELIQTIEFEETSGIWSMIVHGSELIFGLADCDGTGTVYVYSRKGDVWEFSQEIRKGIVDDNFGSAIDVEGEIMVIGADAMWTNCIPGNDCMGRVYVYQKREGVWEETQEIMADTAESGVRFGTCVGIYGDLILVGSLLLPLHVYQFNGEWELLRTDEFRANAIAHCNNNFLLGGEFESRAFLLEADGSFSENTINPIHFRDNAWFGEIIEMRDSLAIVSKESEDCYLLKYANRKWSMEKILSPDPGENCYFHGIEITDQYAIIGGMSSYEYETGYVYFRDL